MEPRPLAEDVLYTAFCNLGPPGRCVAHWATSVSVNKHTSMESNWLCYESEIQNVGRTAVQLAESACHLHGRGQGPNAAR